MDPTRNFVKVQVATGYDHLATSIVLIAGDGARLPDPMTEGAFNMTWWNDTDFRDPSDDPNRERVRVTARSVDTLTIIRNQEGTPATAKNLAGKTYRMAISWGRHERDQLREFPLTTRGDIPVHDGTRKVRLPVGATGQVPIADPAQSTGIRWDAPLPRVHDHSLAADGTPIAVAGVPALPASRITSERFPMERMPDGTLGHVLTAQGAGLNPIYAAAGGGGITSGWELIRTGTFTNNTNITGLDGNADRVWMLVMRLRSTTALTTMLRFNDDAGATNYAWARWAAGAVGAVSMNVTNILWNTHSFLLPRQGFLKQFYTIMIMPISGQERSVFINGIEESSIVDIMSISFAGTWTNTIANLITINIITGSITAGEFFLFRRRV